MPALTVRSLGECAIKDLALRRIERRDVLVRIDASGMCHSDTSVYNGDLGGRLPDGRLDVAAMLGRTIALADAPAVLRDGPTTTGRTVIVP